MIQTERDLASVAGALIGKEVRLSAAERRLVPRMLTVSARTLNAIRTKIRAGADPLGEIFCSIRSSEQRRSSGATYTPKLIIDAMIAWAAEAGIPSRIVDPGAGSGRFLIAAAQAFPTAELVAVEIDPLASLLMRANAAVLGFSKRLTVQLIDYRELTLPRIDGPTLFIGNPPYVRHHNIQPEWKRWLGDAARSLGFAASGLAGLHIHFFVKTRHLARPGDFGAFITAAEWLDVNYGSVLRRMLANGLGGIALHVIDPKALPFSGTFTTGAITCFRVGYRSNQFRIRTVASLDELSPLSQGAAVAWSEVEAAPRWSNLLRQPPMTRDTDGIELGELFRVHRGQVSGCNAAWIVGPNTPILPARYLFPTITRARELLSAGDTLGTTAHLRAVVDLPVDLDELPSRERGEVDEFLAWAKGMKAHQSFIATHRRAWWSVGLKRPASILCTYMARRAPAFVLNPAGARHLNIAHGLYPRGPLAEQDLRAVLTYLRRHTSTAGGRVYAGGLVKFEPKELERLRLPRLEAIHGYLAEEKSIPETVGAGRAASRRAHGDAHVSE